MFVTHFKSIIGDINAHMGFLSEEEVLFLYKVNYQLLNFFSVKSLFFLNWIFFGEIKLQQGQCSSSFGVNVAKLAEMPEPILQRAIGK